jgi:cytochrome P450
MPDETKEPTPIDPAEWVADPHACFTKHRAEHWWAPFKYSGFPEILEYRAVRELLSAGDRLHAYDGGFIEDVMRRNPALSEEHIRFMREATAKSLINIDGTEHDRLRALVARAFTPSSVSALTPFIETLACDLAAQMAPGDDFLAGFARELPSLVVCRLLGIPPEDHVRFIAWIDVLEVETTPMALAKLDEGQAAEVRRTQTALHSFIRELLASRRAEPRDDLISRLVHDAEDVVDDEALVQLISDVNFAGLATTRNGLGNMMLAMTSHQDVWEAVASEPARAQAVVEEVLRLHGPTPGPVRRSCANFEYRGRAFTEGETMALSIWSANRDERFWGADADEFDPGRAHAGEHLTFGHGPHFCLGAALARELLRAALVALAERMVNLEVIEATMLPVGGVYGPKSLRIGFEVRGG